MPPAGGLARPPGGTQTPAPRKSPFSARAPPSSKASIPLVTEAGEPVPSETGVTVSGCGVSGAGEVAGGSFARRRALRPMVPAAASAPGRRLRGSDAPMRDASVRGSPAVPGGSEATALPPSCDRGRLRTNQSATNPATAPSNSNSRFNPPSSGGVIEELFRSRIRSAERGARDTTVVRSDVVWCVLTDGWAIRVELPVVGGGSSGEQETQRVKQRGAKRRHPVPASPLRGRAGQPARRLPFDAAFLP